MITVAAKHADIHRTRHYAWLVESPQYAKAFQKVDRLTLGLLEDEAKRRALEGIEEPVFQMGLQVGVIRRYSDQLLMKLLAANDPKYGNKSVKDEWDGDPDNLKPAPRSAFLCHMERRIFGTDDPVKIAEERRKLLAGPDIIVVTPEPKKEER